MDRLDGEAAERDLLARADLMEDRAGRKAVLLELVLDKTNRQLGGVDRHIEFLSRYGRLPMWSSWPWVMNRPLMRSLFSST